MDQHLPEARALQESLFSQGAVYVYLDDNRGAFDMQSTGDFTQRHPDGTERNSQLQLIDTWKKGVPAHNE